MGCSIATPPRLHHFRSRKWYPEQSEGHRRCPIKEMVSRAKRGAPAMSDEGNGVPSKARGTGYVRRRKWCPEQSKAHHLSTTKEIVSRAKRGTPTSLSCSGAAFECTPATFSADKPGQTWGQTERFLILFRDLASIPYCCG